MGRIVAIAGGELETTHTIHRYLVALAKKERANLLFVGTASHDDEAYIAAIHREFERFGCAVRELCLTTERNTEHEVDELLNQVKLLLSNSVLIDSIFSFIHFASSRSHRF